MRGHTGKPLIPVAVCRRKKGWCCEVLELYSVRERR
jgi:hypothetical protein